MAIDHTNVRGLHTAFRIVVVTDVRPPPLFRHSGNVDQRTTRQPTPTTPNVVLWPVAAVVLIHSFSPLYAAQTETNTFAFSVQRRPDQFRY